MSEPHQAALDEAMRVEVFDGEIILSACRGPAAVALTPAAAAETSRRLRAALHELEDPSAPTPRRSI